MTSVSGAWLIVPIGAALVIYLARVVELRTKRQTEAGPVRERTTLRAFIFAGCFMLVGGIAELLLLRHSVS